MMDIMRRYWLDMVPMQGRYGGRAAILFRGVHALMSYQLQNLITRSITYLFRTLDSYAVSFNLKSVFIYLLAARRSYACVKKITSIKKTRTALDLILPCMMP